MSFAANKRRKSIITQSSSNKPAKSSDMLFCIMFWSLCHNHLIAYLRSWLKLFVYDSFKLRSWGQNFHFLIHKSRCDSLIEKELNRLKKTIQSSLLNAGFCLCISKCPAPHVKVAGLRAHTYRIIERDTTCCSILDWLSGCTRHKLDGAFLSSVLLWMKAPGFKHKLALRGFFWTSYIYINKWLDVFPLNLFL